MNLQQQFKTFFIFLLFIFCLSPSFVFSQTVKSTSNKRAIKYYYKGEKFMGMRDFERVVKYAKKAASTDPNFVEAYIMLAEVYSF